MGQAPVTNTCSGESCACNSDAYNASGFGGGFQGLVGIFGAGGFFKTTNDAPLKKATDEMKQVQAYWSQIVGCLKDQIEDDRFNEIVSAQKTVDAAQTAMIQTLNFKLDRNTLLIVMLCVLVFFLIIFDLTLPTSSVTGVSQNYPSYPSYPYPYNYQR